jgi:hypothetical protein
VFDPRMGPPVPALRVRTSSPRSPRSGAIGATAPGSSCRSVRSALDASSCQTGWENGPHERIGGKFRTRSLLISKSTVRGQSAEAVIFWTGFRDGGEATPCAELLSSAIGRSTADLAAAVARAPGTKVIRGPTRVTLGGRPAQHVVLTVREDLGCDPGFFFTWRPSGPRGECWGACWLESSVGDTIRVWIVDVHGTRLFIEAETDKQASRDVEQEITKIVGSIGFK